MTRPALHLRTLSPSNIGALAPALGEILIDCVEGGASVSFMRGLTPARAAGFWRSVSEKASDGRAVIVAEDAEGPLGVVQVIPAGVDNQPHRGDVSKMLVHRRSRRHGVGRLLMQAVETEARRLGMTLLVLDTQEGSDAERLYARDGWTRAGTIPDYALTPDGALIATALYWKRIV